MFGFRQTVISNAREPRDTHKGKAPSSKKNSSVYEKYEHGHLGSWYI